VWAILFAAASFYWAAGGSVGETTIAAMSIEPGWQTRCSCGALASSSWSPGCWPWRSFGLGAGPIARSAAWVVAAGLVLYGAMSFVDHLLMEVGARVTPRALGSTAVRWHLALWDPFWLLGGVLFVAAARACRRDRSPDAWK
jgi:hypothetical protein